MKIHIKNGRLIDPKQGVDAVQDIFIAKGKIIAIGAAPNEFQPSRVIDAKSLIVCPGLVDLSVRLREPGLEYKATLESEMEAAVAGGVTSFACPPDTDPPLDEPGLVEMLKHRAKNLNQAHVYPIGALTQGLRGERLTEMAELNDAGCVVFGQPDGLLPNLRVLMQAMRYASTFGFSVWLRPQEISLTNDGVAHDGEVATRLGLPTVPVCAETIAISNIILLAKETGVRVHLCRISSAEGLTMVRAAKQQGLPMTCDVTINHLHLSDMDIGFFDSNCHLMPPLRGLSDRNALRNGLLDGTIDAVCSDHAPVDEDAKLLPFGQSEIGATGVELLLPLTLKWGNELRLPLLKVLAKITSDPSGILGIDAGDLSVGSAADICIFDPDYYWKVTAPAILSQGKNTPFMGMELPGNVKYTLVDGHIVYER
ncbi:MAG: dihydroorotase [Nitrosomonas sp.]|jgi:dihydroorotase|uniref:dihydroorotase n=1 Tax=Nitrosomonas sp. TaxID=42353 RepID=UPI00272747A2|nr:dihydroorotase [Nitrosomonas sp.]MDO8895495.1 dihydroorotase [Nitrosomonas sp.]MDO9469667.1 dihydroorotase [Nitrosomonas sp.]MDP1549357.1 dihydroorotase [Nitrosomonas sp.]MDP1788026.1 dihydroorotase [Nitrosomonas sp.]MDP1935112.1 dihydroorotase [Nitrosomonas sp.]